ncbi:unnamed protein product [Paramecium sonneborni]|uniref:HTH La-type RNA-binding domain-containing protein n=1 Tax=Paramecium sonneborni TaxID=65129 RepID=A0A8S1P4R0_9CILI|nr:unnamed protein product [Paramecium sonneborni]
MSIEEIKRQVEYYLSDKNLSQDEFFSKQISQSQDGYLQLQFILKCNKVKQMKITQEQLIEAIKTSTEVELSPDQTSVRRLNNKPLPELIITQTNKKVKTNTGEAVVVQQQQEEKPEEEVIDNPYHNFEPLIFTVKAPTGVAVNWTQITEALMKQHNISSPYVRYGKTEGNFALSKPRTPEENIIRLTSEGIKIGEHQLEIRVTNGEDLTQFWAHHGKHYETIIKRAKETFAHGGAGKGGNKKYEQRKQKKDIVFHNQKYRDISQLKNIFKTILARSENNTPLKEPYHSMLVSLLQYHDKKDQKLNGLKHFTVGQHPDHAETRCFFAVKEDGSSEDFSSLKCIKNLETSLGL